ncbi:type II toxin-antitoxin system RelB/DinJ family antitoxin [Adlercreutzia sp. ZJ154]|uniref:type II toxin-antitoxin system RelB/DinJ family antitoxin n=1 Tax=Adlercreutzia sp. ZJ154 TaxID=2709790 RepID=UPI00197EB604|nr:type II toxin-antitoxin system RelB/DinJ family antitoxin [Adlercreutzia sp. ZJ154]
MFAHVIQYITHANILNRDIMTTTYAVRIDEDIKNEASKVAKYYGLDLATATRAFWTQMAHTKSIPLYFVSEEPNEESMQAIRDTDKMIATGSAEVYNSAEELFEALGI